MSTFRLSFTVRDYECDLQGIVNNAVYQNYLEHTRHEFLKSKGLDFAKFFDEGVSLVLYRVEIDYKSSLKSGDSFICELSGELVSDLRVMFKQKIVRTSDDKLIVDAKVYATGIGPNKRPCMPSEVKNLFL